MMQIIVVVIMAMALIIGGTKLLRAADERERIRKGSNVVMSEYREGMEKPSSRVKSPEKEPTIQPLYGVEQPAPEPIPDPGPIAQPLYGVEPIPMPTPDPGVIDSFAKFLANNGIDVGKAKLGDWNGDGKVGAKDMRALHKVYQKVRHALKEGTLKAEDISLNGGKLEDLNGDGEVNKRDVHILFKQFAKTIREKMHKGRPDDRPIPILPPQDGRPDRPMTIIAAPPQS